MKQEFIENAVTNKTGTHVGFAAFGSMARVAIR